MTVIHAEKLDPPTRVEVSWSEGLLKLHDNDLFGRGRANACIRFLRHVFSLSEVTWVEVDGDHCTAAIHYDARCFRPAEFLHRLAMALRAPLPPCSADTALKHLERDLIHLTGCVKVRRFGTMLTTWSIIHERPGRIRLRHQTVYRNAALANRLRSVVENLDGVIEYKVWPITGSVLIRFDPDLTSASYLLQLLDFARRTPDSWEQMPSSLKTGGFGLANSSLALAACWRASGPVLATGFCFAFGGLESPYVPRCRAAIDTKTVRTSRPVYKHCGGDTRQRPIHRISYNELDAHLLVAPIP